MRKGKILVTGALGQLGTDLTLELRKKYGNEAVLATDIKNPSDLFDKNNPFEHLDVLNKEKLAYFIQANHITEIYHLAALLSATSENNPQLAWKLNVDGLLNVLNAIKDSKNTIKLFWPSSIAVFGVSTPKINTPQNCLKDPATMYGISKLSGEHLCEYYYKKFGVDVRSLRYPGLISYKSLPGGGTTDYAVHIFYEAIKKQHYHCFLKENTELPMMYMPDAVNATIELMEAKAENVKIRSSYNITAMSFTPYELVSEIQKHIPGFSCTYFPDFRQGIADSWPQSIDDSSARDDWGWKPKYDIAIMTEDMILSIKKQIGFKEPIKSKVAH